MRRAIIALVGLVAFAAMFVVRTHSTEPADVAPGPTSAARQAPQAAPLPEPRFTRTMYATTGLADSTAMLDVCRGPVAVDLGESHPVLVAEHDYCGGSAWMPRLAIGDAVVLKGVGVDAGTYVVTEIRFQLRGVARVSDLPPTDAVLQTCVSKEKMVLVGIEKRATSVAS